jgi:hypothetical protein
VESVRKKSDASAWHFSNIPRTFFPMNSTNIEDNSRSSTGEESNESINGTDNHSFIDVDVGANDVSYNDYNDSINGDDDVVEYIAKDNESNNDAKIPTSHTGTHLLDFPFFGTCNESH